MSLRSGGIITWHACPPAAAKDCRAPFSKRPPAAAPSSPPTSPAAGRWCATASKGSSSRPTTRRARRGLRPTGRRRPISSPGWARRRGSRVLDGFTERGRDGGGQAALPRRPRRVIADPDGLHPAETRACCRCRTRRRSPFTWPTKRRRCGRRPRRSSATSACRRLSGPSRGRAGRRSPATSSTIRRPCGGAACSISPRARGSSAIAAVKAGAAHVTACDIDDFAIAAIGLNAAANGVAVTAPAGDLVGRGCGWDTILAGDICYERELAQRVTDWLFAPPGRGRHGPDRRPGPQLPAAGRGCECARRIRGAGDARPSRTRRSRKPASGAFAP